ncbi:NADPH:quinone reductase [Clostridia bacterium]|nr:NADPH:quinone reductase [Clostridia bacterium]
MKAIIYKKYGSPDNLKLAEVEKPTPKNNEVLIKIRASCVNAYDWHLMRGKPFMTRLLAGLFRPKNKILGADISGTVESVGSLVTKLKIGDNVYGCLESCGKGGLAAGGFAEYVTAKESVLAIMPSNINFESAAAVPMAAVTALQAVRDKGQLKNGQKVLINGATGGVGSFAVQIAKSFGAEVTGVCSSGNMEIVSSLGADFVVDYTKENFTTSGKTYDLIIDIVANHSIKDYRRSLVKNGICVVVGFGGFGHTLRVMFAHKKDGKKIVLLVANNKNNADLLFMNTLLESGKVKPFIDKHFTLAETADAIRYVETKHAKGKVVIKNE